MAFCFEKDNFYRENCNEMSYRKFLAVPMTAATQIVRKFVFNTYTTPQ
jgi:hypothetical protein